MSELPAFDHLPACWNAARLAHASRRLPAEPLPPAGRLPETWRDLFRAARHELEHGSGVLRIAGFDVLEESAAGRGFVRFTDLLGTPLSQNAAGETLLRVEDEGHAPDDPRYRGPHSRARLGFHSDRCDVIAFLCVRPALRGGETSIVSSVRIYERLRHEAPSVLEVLCGSFPFLRHTIDPAHPRPWVELPIFSWRDGAFAGHCLRVLIERAHASPHAPDLTAEQSAALDLLERIAEEEALAFRLEPGEVLLLNNWVTFHRRSAFDDAPQPGRRRLLLRRWLSMPDNRPLDERFREHFGAVEAGQVRGGIRPGSP